jgi:hypothetical protein
VKIDDGFKIRDMKIYGGDLRIVSDRMEDSALYKECLECHTGSAADILVKGGKHNEMGCRECHIGHPPEVAKPYRPCTECHQPHSKAMTEEDCNRCHKAHAIRRSPMSWHRVEANTATWPASFAIRKGTRRHPPVKTAMAVPTRVM